jgi:arylsulfatase A-like enzyme
MYDCLVKVPLIIQWADNIPKGRFSGLVELVDLFPTLMDFVCLDKPRGLQGNSFWPAIENNIFHDKKCHRSDIYSEYYNAMPWHSNPAAYVTMLRTEEFKLMIDHSGAGNELYNLIKDPDEHINEWNNPNYRDTIQELLVRMCDRQAYTIDPLPERVADW